MKHYLLYFLAAALLLSSFPFFSAVSSESIQEFYVDPQYETKGNAVEKALHLTSSTRAQFFVEKDYYDSLTASGQEAFLNNIANLGIKFDTDIYSKEKAAFGDEWLPGIDNDYRITVYATLMRDDINGYFREQDEYDYTSYFNSNRREMIYINAKYITYDKAPAILAHEFQHLINFNQKRRLRVVDEERWLNEALSEYAVTLTGYDGAGDYLKQTIKDFLANPTDALGIWEAASIDKASVSLFIHYLVGQYGEEILRDMVQSNLTGGEAVNYVLQKNGSNKTLSDVFYDWTVALFLNSDIANEMKLQSAPYKFTHFDLQYNNLHVMPQLTYSVGESGINASFAARDLAPEWHRFLPARYDLQNSLALNINFTSRDDYYFRIPVVVTYLSGDIEVLETEIKNGKGSMEILDFNTKISSVVIIPASHTKLSGFSQADPLRAFSYSVSLARPVPPKRDGARADGDLIRAENRPEVYVIKDGFRRHLQHPIFFDFYGHLRWENVQVVSADIAQNHKESKLIRRAGDYKVYEIVGFQKKQWLDMTPAEFEKSGRKWEAVYEVNNAEWKWYEEISNF